MLRKNDKQLVLAPFSRLLKDSHKNKTSKLKLGQDGRGPSRWCRPEPGGGGWQDYQGQPVTGDQLVLWSKLANQIKEVSILKFNFVLTIFRKQFVQWTFQFDDVWQFINN